MQLHDLFAAILYRRNKRTFARIETVDYVRPQLIQQSFELLCMQLTSLQISKQFLRERLPVIVRIIDPKINHPHPFRKRIKRRPVVLISSHNSHIPSLLLNKVPYLIEKHALHSSGIICRVDQIKNFHTYFHILRYPPCLCKGKSRIQGIYRSRP